MKCEKFVFEGTFTVYVFGNVVFYYFQEALATVSTAHDFGIVFDNYAKFLELLVSKLIQSEA